MATMSTQPFYKLLAANRQPPPPAPVVQTLGEAALMTRLGIACNLSPREWRLICNAAQRLYGRNGAINTAVVGGLPLAWWVVWSDAIPCRDDWLWLHAAYVALEPLLWRRAQAGLPSLQTVLRGFPAPSLAAVADAFRHERLYRRPTCCWRCRRPGRRLRSADDEYTAKEPKADKRSTYISCAAASEWPNV